MATAESVDIKEEFLTCSICYEVFTEPKSLPCLHNFCEKCLRDYIMALPGSERRKGFRCPTCRELATVPQPSRPPSEWPAQFKTNFQWKALIDMLARHPPATPAPTQRPACKGDNSAPSCSEHAAPLDLYCADCCLVVCHLCAGVRHRRCGQVLTLQEAAAQRRAMLDISLAQFTDLRRHAHSVSMEIDKAMRGIQDQKSKTEAKITATADGLVKIIKEKEAQLKGELREQTETIERKVRTRVTQVTPEVSSIDSKSTKLKELRDKASDLALMQENLDSVLERQPFTNRAVEQLCQALSSVTVDFSPAFVLNERLKEKLNLGSVHLEGALEPSQEDATLKTTLQSIHQPSSNVLRPRAVTLSAVNTPARASTAPVLLRTIRASRREDTHAADLRDVVLLTPGHTLVVTDFANQSVKAFFERRDKDCSLPMGGKPWGIAQLSATQVVVSLPLTRQICQLRVTSSLMLVSSVLAAKRYAGLAALDNEHLVATAASNPPCVDVINLAGEVTRSFTCDARQLPLFAHPAYAACSQDGNAIYVSDKDKAALTCLDREGRVVWRFSPKGSKRMIEPRGLCVGARGDGKVVVVERRGVLLFTSRGDFRGPLLHLSQDSPAPQGMCMSPAGQLYLTQGGDVSVYRVK